MSSTTSFLLSVSVLAVALGLSYRPFGDYLARVYTSSRHLRVERWMYRAIGVDPDADQRWSVYARCLVAFSLGIGALPLPAPTAPAVVTTLT